MGDMLVQMDARICMAALREAAIQARRSRDNVQDFGTVLLLCPLCPDQSEMLLFGAIASLKLCEVRAALR